MPRFLKYVLIFVFYIVAIILCLGGVTAIAGVPLGIIGAMLQRNWKINID